MPFELDHLFICTSVEAPQGDRLIEFGLTEGPGNSHPGQGTANRRFFFHAVRFKEITQVRITMPQTQPHSAALRAVAESGCASFTAGELHLIEIGFDGCSQGQSVDFRPDLPLIFHW